MSWVLIFWFWEGTTNADPETFGTFDSQIQCELTLERLKNRNIDVLRRKKIEGVCIPARLKE